MKRSASAVWLFGVTVFFGPVNQLLLGEDIFWVGHFSNGDEDFLDDVFQSELFDEGFADKLAFFGGHGG